MGNQIQRERYSVNIEQKLVERVRSLPLEKQRELLDFAEFLCEKNVAKRPRRSPKGLWANLNTDITEADIAQARQDMWGNFPRDIA
jgi:Protein of unknown function (DUF2281)